ncbi:MAG: hypothetical protein ACW990_10195, partial [Promethearchaeota archaeon]
QRYVKLAYYCEECGANCCSDCLHEKKVDFYTCQECNSQNIENSTSEKKKVCRDCGHENIIKTTQLLKSCPKCGSHKVINIYEKKEELEKQFLELIKNFRSFVYPLREALDSLFTLRQDIKSARDPPIRCFHYPKMESDLISLFKLYIYVHHTLFDKVNAQFHQMELYKEYFFDIYAQPNSNITVIEGIFDNLLRGYKAINEFVINNVKTFKDSINSFKNNLKFIEKISLYFSTYKNFLNIADREKPVYAIQAKLNNGLNTEERFKKDRGILFITNLDLSFVHEYGMRKKKKALTFKAPVQDLIRIREKGKVFKRLYIEFEYGKYEFTLPNDAISRVIEYILLARTFDETTVHDATSASKLQKIDVDLNELVNFIEESINSFFSLKCEYNKSYEQSGNYSELAYHNVNVPQQQFPNSFHQGQNPNISYQNPNNPYQNPNIPYQNPNIIQNEYQQHLVQNSGRNPQHFPSNQFQIPQILNNNRIPINPYQGSTQVMSKFFPQNLYNQNRFQNYNPKKGNPIFKEFRGIDENNALLRNLEQSERLSPSFESEFSRYQEYNINHLSDLFDPNNALSQQPYGYKQKLFKLDKEKNEKMLELQKEKYGLKATLKKLETKFDQGSISEADYFRTFRNLNKEIYLIDMKIQSLQQNLEELNNIKQSSRNFDNKRFYT